MCVPTSVSASAAIPGVSSISRRIDSLIEACSLGVPAENLVQILPRTRCPF